MIYKRGFTLIELLVVIAIIAILSSIVIAGLSGAKSSGRDAKRISDIKNIQLALSLYYNDNLKYPTTLSALTTGGYLSTLPKDPSNSSQDYFYRAFRAKNPSNPGDQNCSNVSYLPIKYHLLAGLEGATPPDDDLDSIDTSAYIVCSGYLNPTGDYTGSAIDCQGTASPQRCYGVTNN